MRILGYHAMRMRWCARALRAFLRRWGVHLLVASALAGGASSTAASAPATIEALCAWLVLPLFRAAAEPAWLVPAVVLQAMLGAALVWGMRALLWPVHWAAAERALPIARRDTLISDSVVVSLGLAPLVLLYGVGAEALIARDPAWLHPVMGRAAAGLAVSIFGSVMLGVGVLQGMRRAGLAPAPRPASDAVPRWRAAGVMAPVRSAGWRRVLLWWPLWRGPAKRSGATLCAGLAILCLPSLGLLRWPQAGPWWLAAYAALGLLVVTRLNALTRLELTALLRSCAPLPLRTARLQCGRALLALVPLLPSALLLLACLPLGAVRPPVLAAYVATCLASCAIEVFIMHADAASKSSRWLFCLVLLLALASEVMR
jgi:hypothetical protein